MSENEPVRKVVTIVHNNYWDMQQEVIVEAIRVCDICINLIRKTHDGDCDDIATSQDLIERRLVEMRQSLERIRSPF